VRFIGSRASSIAPLLTRGSRALKAKRPRRHPRLAVVSARMSRHRGRAGRRRLVLLVESEPALAQVLRRALTGRRTVVVVSTIAEAIEKLEPAKRFDAIVTSARLFDGSALRLLRMAKRRCPDVRRILYVEPTTARPTLTAAADCVVLTSAPIEELRAAVGP
jgi:CheY-like chemotaxis protein